MKIRPLAFISNTMLIIYIFSVFTLLIFTMTTGVTFVSHTFCDETNSDYCEFVESFNDDVDIRYLGILLVLIGSGCTGGFLKLFQP